MSSTALRRHVSLKSDLDQEKELSPPPTDQASDEDFCYSIFGTTPPTSQTSIPQDEVSKWLDLEDELEKRHARSTLSIQADTPPPNPYPLSQQVLSLEKREQEAQAYCKLLESKCRQLNLTVERLINERDKERSDHEERCKSLEAANNIALEQLEKEQDKVKELNIKNASLVADLAAASEEKTRLTELVEEKTHESHIFRCACCVMFKLASSTNERVTIRYLLRDVLRHYIGKRKREREAKENQVQDQNNEEQQSSEPRPPHDPSPIVTTPDAAKSDADSESLLPRGKRLRIGHGERRQCSDLASN
jgi:hypothetical protein